MPINDMRKTSNNNNYNDDNSKPITCPMCGCIFYTQQALERHKQDDHNEPNSPPRHYR